MFEPTKEELETPIQYETKKKEFHKLYVFETYPPGIHRVTGDKSIIKHFDIFSNAYNRLYRTLHTVKR